MTLPLKIVYEDEALLFVDKPAGIVVQRGYDPDEPVLLEIAASYLARKGEKAILMQRLDRGTSGLMFFSKLDSVNANLTRQFERKGIRKTYLALCEGKLPQHQLIDAPLLRVGPISFGVRRQGKRSLTDVSTLATNGTTSLARLHLLTGRTHQIRVHLAATGHPLVGDWLYGIRNAARPMLHALALSMRHPLTGADLTLGSEPPADFFQEAQRRGIPGQVEASFRSYNLP